MILSLLQQRQAPLLRLETTTPIPNTFFLILAIAGLLIFLVWAIFMGTKASSSKPGSYSKRSFRKRLRQLKLTQEQIKLLEVIIAEMKFPNPLRILESPAALDRLLRYAMNNLDDRDLGPQEKEFRKGVIYDIKQIIEGGTVHEKIISSTQSLPINTKVKISDNNGVSYTSYITSNMQNMLGLESPLAKGGVSYPWAKGQALSVTFIRGGTDVYSYQTKVLGYRNVRGVFSVFTEHGKNLKQIQQRQGKRKEISRPVILYLVNIVETKVKRKIVRQAVVNKTRSLLGSMQDISAGGCAIMSRNTVPRGSLVKIDFETVRGKPVTVYGKVRAASSNSPRSKILHIQFTNVSRKNMNTIRDFIYEYDIPS